MSEVRERPLTIFDLVAPPSYVGPLSPESAVLFAEMLAEIEAVARSRSGGRAVPVFVNDIVRARRPRGRHGCTFGGRR